MVPIRHQEIDRSSQPMEPDRKPRLRWKSISIRGLLLLILVFGLWLGWVVNQAHRQREAVAALQPFGGFVHYDWEFVDGRVKVPRGDSLWKPTWGTLTPGRKPWAPDWLRRLVGAEYFQSIAHVSLYVNIQKGQADATWVNKGTADDALRKLVSQTSTRTLQLGGNQVTDDNLADVGQMTGLEELSISWAFPLTDRGFTQLSELKRLRILYIDKSKMTDASLTTFGRLTNLEELRVGGVGFSDRGLASLGALRRLKELSLEGKNDGITDAGIASLLGLGELEHLDLGDGCRVTDDGIARLRALTKLNSLHIGLPDDLKDREKRWQELLPGVKIE